MKPFQLSAIEILPNYEESVPQMVIPNLSRKTKALLVTSNRDMYEAGSQLIDALIWKRKDNGHLSLSLQDFQVFVQNSAVEPMMEDLKFLVKRAAASRKAVRVDKLAETLLGTTKKNKFLKGINRFLDDIADVLKKVGKKFQAKLSVPEFNQVLQKALPPPNQKQS